VCGENPRFSDTNQSDYFCFATHNKNDTTGELTPNLKGCIVGLQHSDCNRDQCLAEPFHADPNVYHCCCTTKLCNANVEMLPVPTISPGWSVLYLWSQVIKCLLETVCVGTCVHTVFVCLHVCSIIQYDSTV